MFRSLAVAALATATTLGAAATANAATGHACQVNGAAAGCPAALNIPAGSTIVGADVGAAAADDFAFVGAGNALRCRNNTIKGTLLGAGGPAFPIGGTGPVGFITAASFTGPAAGGACVGAVGGAAATGTVKLVDSNGAAAGLVDYTGTWVGGAATPATISLTSPRFVITETTAAAVITCTYTGFATTGIVTNNALGRVNFVAQPVTKIAGPAPCPVNATITVPFNLRWNLAAAGGPFRISA